MPMPNDTAVRSLLRVILAAEHYEGQRELLAQVDHVRVVGGPVTMLELAVDPSVTRSSLADGPVPGSAWAINAAGDPLGTLVVWVADGYLSALEYGWVTDDAPNELPPIREVRTSDA